jgi:hypothetical protein
MYVNRQIFTVKPGAAQEVFELCQRILSRHSYPHTTRVYRNVVGKGDHIVVEFECESLTDWEKIHPEWGCGWPEDLAAEWQAHETGFRSEFWEVEEQRANE